MDVLFLNEPQPDADALVALWTAGDPFHDNAPTVLRDWVQDYDRILGGRVLRAIQETGFTWTEGQHLHLPTGGALPFEALILVGGTPPEPWLWKNWIHVGGLVRRALREAETKRVAILIDRIFATGLEDLATGICTPQGPDDDYRPSALHVTGSIDWAQADHDAVVRGAKRGLGHAPFSN